jgi:hypothetical protein
LIRRNASFFVSFSFPSAKGADDLGMHCTPSAAVAGG